MIVLLLYSALITVIVTSYLINLIFSGCFVEWSDSNENWAVNTSFD